MESVGVVVGLLMLYLIGIIGCVSGVGVGNVFRGARRSTCSNWSRSQSQGHCRC